MGALHSLPIRFHTAMCFFPPHLFLLPFIPLISTFSVRFVTPSFHYYSLASIHNFYTECFTHTLYLKQTYQGHLFPSSPAFFPYTRKESSSGSPLLLSYLLHRCKNPPSFEIYTLQLSHCLFSSVISTDLLISVISFKCISGIWFNVFLSVYPNFCIHAKKLQCQCQGCNYSFVPWMLMTFTSYPLQLQWMMAELF